MFLANEEKESLNCACSPTFNVVIKSLNIKTETTTTKISFSKECLIPKNVEKLKSNSQNKRNLQIKNYVFQSHLDNSRISK